ncbi:MAG TPA: hypothetical protein VNW30_08785 [Opitutaceae bacterium]|jgi:hypothetical protein|nr:hypothetical protein [Opitutaceae bacterium]
MITAMTKLAEIKEAILHLPSREREELVRWLSNDDTSEMLAAIDAADCSDTEGGVGPDEVCRNLKQ